MDEVVDHQALAVALIDISADVRRKSLKSTGLPALSSGVLDILRVIENHPGTTIAEVAARLDRQLSNVSTQLRELVSKGLVTRTRDDADKRYVALHPTEESLRIKTLLESTWADSLAGAATKLTTAEQEQLNACIPVLQRLASTIGE